jgi:DNA-binding response OmpR family regulator
MNAPRTLSPEEFAIFSYLYEHQGDYCSKRDIYNKAYLPFNSKGQGRELGPNDELTKEFDDLVNTTIYRLRKTIEPLPKSPVFLTMKKNLGYRLSLQAFLD